VRTAKEIAEKIWSEDLDDFTQSLVSVELLEHCVNEGMCEVLKHNAQLDGSGEGLVGKVGAD